ncbi:MAG: DUF559 domain-containing protein [Proteobacteria bacterium]|nr:DUF559 domain-containing protein [Pseudomonadota bacterium]
MPRDRHELQTNATVAEQRLWRALRDRQLQGYKFRRQHPGCRDQNPTIVTRPIDPHPPRFRSGPSPAWGWTLGGGGNHPLPDPPRAGEGPERSAATSRARPFPYPGTSGWG